MAHSAALSQAKLGPASPGLPWECDPELLPTLQSIALEAANAGTGARLVIAAKAGELRTIVGERCNHMNWRVQGLTVIEREELLIQPGIAAAPIFGLPGMRGAFVLHFDFGYAASQHEYGALARSYAARAESAILASLYKSEALRMAADGMMHMLAAHDAATARHSYIVRRLALSLGESLGLPPHELVDLEIAALLHDVGKVGVPVQLLQKDGALSAQDWAHIRHHPAAGDRMVRLVGCLARVAPAIRHHHERWDGNGYPDRLSGGAIPLAARLISIADAYEAMRTGRPYQQPRTPDEVLHELRRSAGSQFDPALIVLLPVLGNHDLTF